MRVIARSSFTSPRMKKKREAVRYLGVGHQRPLVAQPGAHFAGVVEIGKALTLGDQRARFGKRQLRYPRRDHFWRRGVRIERPCARRARRYRERVFARRPGRCPRSRDSLAEASAAAGAGLSRSRNSASGHGRLDSVATGAGIACCHAQCDQVRRLFRQLQQRHQPLQRLAVHVRESGHFRPDCAD